MLIGAAGTGKSTFAAKHFKETEIVSSDRCRALVSDSETDQDSNEQAFHLFYETIACRMKLGKRIIADATHATEKARKKLYDLASEHNYEVIPVRMLTSLARAKEMNLERERHVPEFVIEKHFIQLQDLSLPDTSYGVYPDTRYHIASQLEVIPIASGVDVIGDVHGCYEELIDLITKLGYYPEDPEGQLRHPQDRALCFVGDFVDRGPHSLSVLYLVNRLLADGHYAVQGNHDNKLWRCLKGNNVHVGPGLQKTLEQIGSSNTDFVRDFLGRLPYQLQFEFVASKERLVVCHAGMPRDMIGKRDKKTNQHCIYGEVSGKNPDGTPNRTTKWWSTWCPVANENASTIPTLVYGHTVTKHPVWQGFARIMNIDGGCCFGKELRAFRWPEKQIVSVSAKEVYNHD